MELSIVISQHVCEHWNYRVCFVENGKCKNCGLKTPELEAIEVEANWIIFWLRLELLFLKPVATSKEEFLKNCYNQVYVFTKNDEPFSSKYWEREIFNKKFIN